MYTIKVQKDYDGNIGRYVKLPLKLQCSFRDQLKMMWRKMQTISPKILIHWFKIKTFSTCLLDFDELFEEYFQIACKKYYWSWLLYMHITYAHVIYVTYITYITCLRQISILGWHLAPWQAYTDGQTRNWFKIAFTWTELTCKIKALLTCIVTYWLNMYEMLSNSMRFRIKMYNWKFLM